MWIFVKGGPVMYPILLASILGLAIIIEKLWHLFTIRLDAQKFSRKVFDLLKDKRYEDAAALCGKNIKYPIAVVFKAGIEKRGLPVADMDRFLERIGN
ncbi:MAG: hypothetical protein PHP46_04945, partial [Candidatus Omnitrophica bacterium]|nr:hypothetical protein [Candidatus Omnitrophota bacterium]